jgi:hypothetical protein
MGQRGDKEPSTRARQTQRSLTLLVSLNLPGSQFSNVGSEGSKNPPGTAEDKLMKGLWQCLPASFGSFLLVGLPPT